MLKLAANSIQKVNQNNLEIQIREVQNTRRLIKRFRTGQQGRNHIVYRFTNAKFSGALEACVLFTALQREANIAR